MRIGFFTLVFCLIFAAGIVSAQTARSITIVTEPKAVVWIDDIRRGATDESGRLEIKPVMAGTRRLRVRADGFKDHNQSLLPAQKGEIKIALTKTTDEAELTFQQAEKMATQDRQKAIELYEKAVKLRPSYPEAHLGMARVLSETGELDKALAAIKNARKSRPVYPEASAVEGRIYKDSGEEEAAIAAFNRAIKEGKGFQPEAHTGLGLFYKDKAGVAASGGDFEEVDFYYDEAAKHLLKAIDQLSASEPVVYLLLGEILEKREKFTEAVTLYERFIREFPDSNEVTAVKSFIVQIKKQMNGEQ